MELDFPGLLFESEASVSQALHESSYISCKEQVLLECSGMVWMTHTSLDTACSAPSRQSVISLGRRLVCGCVCTLGLAVEAG